ncbi:LytTR family DNA-binding domain-containing protein [Paenibacillus agaridevorans]|uniref:LytTR family DNA-binding domain-containing protein n=1 Tax=Paenibacillus agaridevorans TaxID=171404 RepID=UPI001BE47951|nr:LytTR family DNA-binding domain-containing protein [Paenibacillus agaridevorans]
MSMPVFDENNEVVEIDTAEIFCIFKDEARRIMVKIECGDYYFPTTIEQINTIMEKYGFYQIDKNHVINVKQVKAFKRGEVYIDGVHYYVATRRQKGLKELLQRSRNTNA